MYLVAHSGDYTDKKYKLPNVTTVIWRDNTNPMLLPIPEMDNLVIGNFTGIRKIVSVAWNVVDSDEDLSLGTNATPVKTITEQIDYLKAYFMNGSIDLSVDIVFDSEWGYTKTVTIKPYSFTATWTGGQLIIPVRIEGYASEIVL